jgi:hypothetical protein
LFSAPRLMKMQKEYRLLFRSDPRATVWVDRESTDRQESGEGLRPRAGVTRGLPSQGTVVRRATRVESTESERPPPSVRVLSWSSRTDQELFPPRKRGGLNVIRLPKGPVTRLEPFIFQRTSARPRGRITSTPRRQRVAQFPHLLATADTVLLVCLAFG